MKHRDATASKPARSEGPLYCDIERFAGADGHCAHCAAPPQFVLKDGAGHRLLQCADCLVETFRKDPELTGRVLRSVADRL